MTPLTQNQLRKTIFLKLSKLNQITKNQLWKHLTLNKKKNEKIINKNG